MKSVQILILVLLALGAWAAQNAVEKPGDCPNFRQVLSDKTECKEMCNGDNSCSQDLRCCRQGCNWLCMNTTQEKDGRCPLDTFTSSSSEEHRLNRLCPKTCYSDLDCNGEAKCCASSCGRTCTKPIRVKSGQCPAVAKICPRNNWVYTCRSDDDCQGERKCCFFGCGRRCMEPFREEQEAVTRRFNQEENTVLSL
ncbi:whey acidic protein [Sarcophilus harrisii]|uniref:WAP domain-containing protein n=1 Tax=Sarcophilus harrisii TaxID=9305 RepID=G3VUJ3_SARHA|nr:whey acidic protein [Sarcophilus harrisii]